MGKVWLVLMAAALACAGKEEPKYGLFAIGDGALIGAIKSDDSSAAASGVTALGISYLNPTWEWAFTVGLSSDEVSGDSAGFGKFVLNPPAAGAGLRADVRYFKRPFDTTKVASRLGLHFGYLGYDQEWKMAGGKSQNAFISAPSLHLSGTFYSDRDNEYGYGVVDFGITTRIVGGTIPDDVRTKMLGVGDTFFWGPDFGLNFRYNALRVKFDISCLDCIMGRTVTGLTKGKIVGSIGVQGNIIRIGNE